MKKLAILMVALVMLLSVTACTSNEKKEIKLGTSDFSIIVPEGYENTDDDYDEGQIAYYYKDDDSIDFDVYQWAKDDTHTLESMAEHFATLYDTVCESVVINGISCIKFISEEEYDGSMYTVVNFMFEGEEGIAGLCFWTVDTDTEYAAVDEIINTLKKN